MNATARNQYLHTKVMTASPEQLQMMLYDGALRFARQGRESMAKGDLETGCESLIRVQKIVLEMNAGLKFDVDPELCTRQAAIYNYIHRRLVEANLTRNLDALDEAINLIEFQRETWGLLLAKLAQARASADSAPVAELAGVDVAG